MQKKLVLILGGIKSGKSNFALNLANQTVGKRAFIGTAEPFDEEMRKRIEKHKLERGYTFETFEEPIYLSNLLKKLLKNYDVVLIDCLTVWLGNLFYYQIDIKPVLDDFIEVLKNFKRGYVFIVSNEVGLTIIPANELSRKYANYLGILNQRIAEISDEVYLVIAGIPLKIK